MDAKNLLGGKGNTYHWDDLFGSDGLLLGHGANNLDSMMNIFKFIHFLDFINKKVIMSILVYNARQDVC